jgi:hypothetical protein
MSRMLQICTKRFQWVTRGAVSSVQHGCNMADDRTAERAPVQCPAEARFEGAGSLVPTAVRRFKAPQEILHDAPGRPAGPTAATATLRAELVQRIVEAGEGADRTPIAIEMLKQWGFGAVLTEEGLKNKADHLLRPLKNQRFKLPVI